MKNAKLIHIVNDLKKVTLDCFSEASCNWSNQGIIGTHFDWHSSVHAHWMLLSISRIFSDMAVVKKITARFDRANFEYERQLLLKNPNFELPYGQSWLLLLLSELEKHDILFAELKNETIIRVIDWHNQTEFPQKSAGNYHSWLISYFLLRKSGFQYQSLGWALLPKYTIAAEINEKKLIVLDAQSSGVSNYGVWWLRSLKTVEPVALKLKNWLQTIEI